MRGCEIVWDADRASIAHKAMEKILGKSCIEDPDFRCPLLPATLETTSPMPEKLVRS